jgi:hypothetical protein
MVMAIDIKHLRIDNWVKQGESLVQFDRSDFEYSNDQISEPIPLTPEILEKCGFVKSDRFENVWFFEGDLALQKDSCFWWTNCWVVTDANEFETLAQFREIQHLHQLQNLIHCLRGKELEIKL